MAVVASMYARLRNVQKPPVFLREALPFRASVFSEVQFKHLVHRRRVHYFFRFVINDEVNAQVFRRNVFTRQDPVAR